MEGLETAAALLMSFRFLVAAGRSLAMWTYSISRLQLSPREIILIQFVFIAHILV